MTIDNTATVQLFRNDVDRQGKVVLDCANAPNVDYGDTEYCLLLKFE